MYNLHNKQDKLHKNGSLSLKNKPNMKYKLLLFLAVWLTYACSQQKPEAVLETETIDLLKYVDPQIGSVHGRWFFYTPAAKPFGMAKLAPHTNAYNSIGSWLPGGYDDRHNSIEGFGHFHEFQVGGLVTMPTVGKIQTTPSTLEEPDLGYRSRFNKATENAQPGYYTVKLEDYNITAELTATDRVGYHRYTFPKTDSAHIIFDLGHKQGESSDVINTEATMVSETELSGFIETYPEYAKFCDPEKHVYMYFFARLSKAPITVSAFRDNDIESGQKATSGINNGLVLTFSTTDNPQIEMQVGLSYVSTENAKLNLETESKENDFDKVVEAAKNAWQEKLNRIKVEGKSETDKTKFYTGLYHALLGRGIASDVNGQYRMNNGETGQIPLDEKGIPKYHHFNTDGMWGGFWNLSQLWALAYPEHLSEYVQANVDLFDETGWLHDGVATGVFTNGVQTNFQGLIIAAAYNAGIRDFDVENAYKAAYENETKTAGRGPGPGKYDLHYFTKMGYVPSYDTLINPKWPPFNFGASHTLEYSFSSYAVAQMAQLLNKQADYDLLMGYAKNWENIFDEETGYVRLKNMDGTFADNFDPMEPWLGFQEGNAAQYTWYVPHDVQGLINKLGKERFNERLEKTFEDAQKSTFGGGDEIDSFSGLEKLYNHGNQPCLHHSWLFNYSGKPWLTQKWTRTICNEFYGTEPLHGYGFGQDEDQGQLGSWYVMAAMGLFDVQGHAAANPTFQFGSPLFDKIEIKLDPTYYNGEKLIISAENNSATNLYIQSVTFNGKPIEASFIDRKALMEGGELHFKMDSIPNKTWENTPPPSMEKIN